MIEYRVILPKSPLRGFSPLIRANEELLAALLKIGGGATVTAGVGYWRDDDGVIIPEHVNVYSVAAPATLPVHRAIYDAAAEAGRVGGQTAVYMVGLAGPVLIRTGDDMSDGRVAA